MAVQMGLVAVAFWLVVHYVDYFDWDQGTSRALILGLVFVCTLVLMLFAGGCRERVSRTLTTLLAVACAVAVAWHVLFFLERLLDPHLLDIATTTLAAGRALTAWQNPYTLPIDAAPYMPSGQLTYNGFKYLPMMAVTFLPLGVVWGERGVVATNLLLDLSVGGLAFLLGSRIGSRGIGFFAALLYLVVPLVPFEIFQQGVTDLAAVVPILGALWILEKKPGLAGMLVGLSLSTKLLPGALFVLCCLPNSGRWRYLGGLILGLVPSLVFLALSPTDFIANTVLFSALRPGDSTSWLYTMPEFSLVARLAFVALFLGVGVYVWFKRPTIVDRCSLGVLCTLGAILSGPVSHRNYQLWWLPFFAVLVASAATWQRTPAMSPEGES
jgi:hypothetical protein